MRSEPRRVNLRSDLMIANRGAGRFRARPGGHAPRTDRPAQQKHHPELRAPMVLRRARCRHLAPEAEVDHAPGGEPEDLGQPARELPDPVQ
jgi:hypothetical protein